MSTSRIALSATPFPLEEAALEWLAVDTQARAMLDGNLNIQWTNAPGAALIGGRDEVESRSGVFSTLDRSRQAALHSFIRGSGATRATSSVPRLDGKGVLLLMSVRTGPGDLFGLTLRRTGPEFRSEHRGLDKAFRLTPAEHRVLLGLLAGKEAEMLAELHGVSIQTTRSHIRSIYLKLEVSSRERLFALAQAFQI